jgi:nucleoside-diphosphate-sugar epimerase
MKLLFIGGTGLISSACSELVVSRGIELFVLNRSVSKKYSVPEGAVLLKGDVRSDEHNVSNLLADHHFDAVVDFIAYTEEDIERDLALFRGKTDQFVFISSASAYQKPPKNYLITEKTPLENPFWQYSRDKIACEERLMKANRDFGFPVTIIRPSLTYGPTQIPFCMGSWQHPWTVIDRMKNKKQVIVPGDGTSLWVMTWNADFAKALVGLLGNPKAIGEIFQITSDEVLTWDQIYQEAYLALGLAPKIVHIPTDLIAAYWPEAIGTLIGDKANSAIFDNSKIKRFVPEFKCEVNWAQGLRKSIAWHESHPQFQTIDMEMTAIFDRILAAYQRAYPTYRPRVIN